MYALDCLANRLHLRRKDSRNDDTWKRITYIYIFVFDRHSGLVDTRWLYIRERKEKMTGGFYVYDSL
jgi:hypothetical protein